MSGNIERCCLEDVLHSFNALSDICTTPCSNLKKKKLVLLFILFLFSFSFTLGGSAAKIFLGITFHWCKRNEFHPTVFFVFFYFYFGKPLSKNESETAHFQNPLSTSFRKETCALQSVRKKKKKWKKERNKMRRFAFSVGENKRSLLLLWRCFAITEDRY